MKKLFTNYNFEFDKNEKKLLTNFCKQALKQVSGDSRFFAEEKVFNSIIEKNYKFRIPIFRDLSTMGRAIMTNSYHGK